VPRRPQRTKALFSPSPADDRLADKSIKQGKKYRVSKVWNPRAGDGHS
jgi:hypothetical protein